MQQVPIGRWNAGVMLNPRIDMMIALIALVVRGIPVTMIKGMPRVKVNVADMVDEIAGNLGKIGSEEIGETSDTNGETLTSAWTDTLSGAQIVDAPRFKLRRGEVKLLTQSSQSKVKK